MTLTLLSSAFVAHGVAAGFPLDDAWIHQVVARNLVDAGWPGFVPGAATGGSTSLLWTLLLAPAHVFGAQDPVTYTRVLSNVLWLATVLGLYGLSRADGWTRSEALAVASGAAVCGNAIWFAWSGMEATLVLAFSVAAVLAWRTLRRRLVDLSLAALALARPEGIGLAFVLAAFEPTWRRRGRLMAAPALAALAMACTSWLLTGTMLPTTIGGRRWLYGLDHGIQPTDLLDFAVQWLYQVWLYLSARSLLLGLVLGWTIAIGAVTVCTHGRTGWSALCAWALVLICIYCPVLPRTGHAGRYQPVVVIVLLPLAAVGLLRLANAVKLRQAAVLTLCAVIALGIPSLVLWHDILGAGIAHIEGTHRSLGRWARINLPPDAKVAAFDIGAIGWELPGRVIDVSGLSGGNLVYLREGRVADLLREQHASFVVLPFPPPGRMTGRARFNLGPERITLEEVQRRTTPVARWQVAFGPTSHAWAGQVLYAVLR